MDVTVGKLVTMFLFLFGAIISTLLPIILAQRQKVSNLSHTRCQTVINACNSIGGGVLLATCFIALVPLVEHSYTKALLEKGGFQDETPYAEITILAGFFLVIFIEQCVVVVQRNRDGAAHKNPTAPEEESLFSDSEEHAASHSHHGAAGHSHNHIIAAKSLLHSIILVVTLGLHTLFEGMAIGLVTDIDILITIVVAVMLHEICCAVALGVNLSQQNLKRTTAVAVCLVFSLMMPAGIGIGLGLGKITGYAGLLVTAVLQGIATGTFIYVLFMEIIPSSLSSGNAIVQMLLMLFGCAFMTMLIVFTHSHENEHTKFTSNALNCTSCYIDSSTLSQSTTDASSS